MPVTKLSSTSASSSSSKVSVKPSDGPKASGARAEPVPIPSVKREGKAKSELPAGSETKPKKTAEKAKSAKAPAEGTKTSSKAPSASKAKARKADGAVETSAAEPLPATGKEDASRPVRELRPTRTSGKKGEVSLDDAAESAASKSSKTSRSGKGIGSTDAPASTGASGPPSGPRPTATVGGTTTPVGTSGPSPRPRLDSYPPSLHSQSPSGRTETPSDRPVLRESARIPKPGRPGDEGPPIRIPPLPPAPAVNFVVGDKAVHPAHGVGEVTAIEKREIGGSSTTFYVLRILDNGMKVMVPTGATSQVGLREIMSESEAEAILDTMRAREVAVDVQPWSRRFRIYTEMIKSKSPHEIAKVLRDMHRLKFDKDLSFGERRLLDQAKSLLMKELALAKKVSETEMEKEVAALFSA